MNKKITIATLVGLGLLSASTFAWGGFGRGGM
jgi:hypothetical protein